MDSKAAEARRAYMREYRRKNKDKIRAYTEAFWKRKAEEMEAAAAAKKEQGVVNE